MNAEMEHRRRVRGRLTFAVDQAGAALRARLPELTAIRDRLVAAGRSGTLREALQESSDYEAVAVLAALVFSTHALALEQYSFPTDDDSELQPA